MGGKKKANRTKGNVRPSSSGRSAELLCSSGIGTTGFIGFSSLTSDILNYVPATSQVCEDDISSAVDGDFRMVMRKMTKRDSVTKLKAIQEFSELCKTKNEELLKGALPYWPRLYNQLAMDFDRRIREATHEAHSQLVKKVGRNLAPHLRSIMGVWLICQADPYSPAASAAKSAFNEAFPESKQGEALMYCKDEIFNYIQDNIFNLTPQSLQQLNDNSTNLTEDIQNKYHRILKCSFEGLGLFILNISPNHYKRIQDSIDKILIETKFWKFARHKELMVQISWYNLILTLCEKMLCCIKPYASKLCPLTLGCLAQNDPLLTFLTWDSVLYVLNIFEDCWQYVNVKKAFFPQLWTILKSGGQGTAVTLFPKLLPLLSKIPENIIEDKITFYQNFFGNIRESLNLEKVQNSSSELNSIIQAFMECIQHVLSKYQASEDKELRHQVILNQLLSLLETSIVEEKSYLASSCFYVKLKDLLDYIQCQNCNNNPLKENFEDILTLFWDNFFIMCKSLLDNESPNQDKELSHLAEFFYCLHCSKKIRKWKVKKKVNFLRKEEIFDEKSIETENNNFCNDNLPVKQPDFIAANHHIIMPTQKLCATVMAKFEASHNIVYLKLLCEVMSIAASQELFSMLLQSSKDISIDNNNAANEYFYKVVNPWVMSIDNISSDKKQYIYCLVNIVMAICSCIDYEAAEDILNDFIKSKNPIMLECLMTFTKFDTFKFLKKWLHSSNIGEIIVMHAEELCQSTLGNVVKEPDVLDSIWNVLHICLTTTEQFEPIIGIEYMSRILEIFHQCLINSKNNQETKKTDVVEFVCDLMVRLFSSFKGCWQLNAAEELLLSLFLLSCDLDSSEPISEKLFQSWQLGVKHLLEEKEELFQENGFFYKVGNKIHHQLLNQSTCIKSEEKLFVSTFKLLTTMYKVLHEESEKTFYHNISLLLTNIFPTEEEWETLQNTLNSQFTAFPVLSDKLTAASTAICPSNAIPQHCLVTLFVSEILYSLICLWENEKDDANNYIFEERSQAVILKQLPNIAMALTYCTYARYDYKTTKYVVDAKEKLHIYQKLNNNLSFLLSKLDNASYLSLINTLSNMSLNNGELWSCTFASTISLEQRKPIKKFIVELSNQLELENIFHLQTLKTVIPYLDTENLKEIIIRVTNLMLCSEDLFSVEGGNSLLGILVCCLEVECILSSEDIQDHMETILEYFLGLKELEVNHYLTYSNLSEQDEGNVDFVSNTMSLLEKIIIISPSIFEVKHWDFTLCSLVGWIETCNRTYLSYDHSPSILRFYIQTFNLFTSISDFMKCLQDAKDTSKYPANLLIEWNDLYTEECYNVCLPLYIKIAENMKAVDLNIGEEIITENLTRVLQDIPLKYVINCKVSLVETNEEIEESEKVSLILDHLMPLLTSGVRSVQLGTHFLLMKIMPKLASILSTKEKSDEDNRSIPDNFIKNLQETGPVVETMLSDFRIGDCCILEPYTDAYTYGRAHLLCWIQLLEFFSAASSEDRSKYASYLRDSGLLQTLLNSLFCLMPHNPSLSSNESGKSKLPNKTMFTEKPLMLINASDTSLELQHLACYVYSSALQKLPALVRQWWTNQEKRTAEIVNRFTSSFVSSLICAKEIQSVHENDKKISNMVVKARPTAREVVATYTIEEVTIELLIQLPPNHPLGPVIVESGRRVGVAQTQWRNWMLQLTTFLTHQNGSILEGLALWKRNVDKRFEGVEECMICFYVVHGSTCQLPRLSCRTCKKKFHSACLYKWFSTSNNSTCPLCRNLF
ncbi:E3 ubiquitin-protein ligase listerin [Centruroides vittatus]|uniref:E3 ubiquitin-protein ligase listerin n=1 Tax=Centruroides vittatus TaxID=120091 RepID=UPI00350F046F